jgi:hypothetical protein
MATGVLITFGVTVAVSNFRLVYSSHRIDIANF